jgi:hypothetical protein
MNLCDALFGDLSPLYDELCKERQLWPVDDLRSVTWFAKTALRWMELDSTY